MVKVKNLWMEAEENVLVMLGKWDVPEFEAYVEAEFNRLVKKNAEQKQSTSKIHGRIV